MNVTPSSLNLNPIRLIYKTGDDLRQDVITLRILSLFEKVQYYIILTCARDRSYIILLSWKLWENEGLHLKLIPYGCLATSTNAGFIEVVKNAKTISEVNFVEIFHGLSVVL